MIKQKQMRKVIKLKKNGECPTCRFLLVKDKVKKILQEMEGMSIEDTAYELVKKLELVVDIRIYNNKNN